MREVLDLGIETRLAIHDDCCQICCSHDLPYCLVSVKELLVGKAREETTGI
jgi:hypothetical protein